jgi:hypothetical protein
VASVAHAHGPRTPPQPVEIEQLGRIDERLGQHVQVIVETVALEADQACALTTGQTDPK